MITKFKQDLSWDSLESAIVRLVPDEDRHMALLCEAMNIALTGPVTRKEVLSFRATPRITTSRIQLILREYHAGKLVTRTFDLVLPTDGSPEWRELHSPVEAPLQVFRGMPFRAPQKIEIAARVS